MDQDNAGKTVLLLGATGTAGRGAARALVAAGHEVVCFGRSDAGIAGARSITGQIGDAQFVAAMQGADAVVSCIASRTGVPQDAWAVDHALHMQVLQAAVAARVGHFVLLSAICVQKPELAFQHAKLAFEEALIASGLRYSIVRPTAYFKSLSGQVARVRAGKPFLVFGSGELTACKPISDDDLGRFIARCLSHPDHWNRILPIGGPGPAITPLEQGAMLCDALGMPVRYKHVPVGLLRGIAGGLALVGRISPRAAQKAALARIGLYYATQSMLVWDGERYDAEATPEFGAETLAAHYAAIAAGDAEALRGDHSVF